jgi:hypothetical protein
VFKGPNQVTIEETLKAENSSLKQSNKAKDEQIELQKQQSYIQKSQISHLGERIQTLEAKITVLKPPEKVIVLYAYEAQGPQELSLEEGVILTVMRKEDDTWWCGQLMNGETGMFPATYVAPYDTES